MKKWNAVKYGWIGVLALAVLARPAVAQTKIVVGVDGALTGPFAGTTAPPVDGLRIYVDRLNAAGGINGRKIELVVLDDQGQPSRAAANVKKLVTQDQAQLVVLSSLSSTFAPVVAETKAANVPLFYMGSVCPKEVFPPADPNQFCTTAYALRYDSRATLAFIKSVAKEPVRIGFSAMAIPLSRGEIDYAEELSKTMGMTPVDKEDIPPTTADYTPFATKLKDANPNWMYAYAPWVTQIRTFEALRRLGWEGNYITWAHIEAEAELARLKDPKFYVIGANSLFQDKLPIHKEIIEAVKKASAKYPAEQMTEGWIGGMVVEAALKRVKGTPNADGIRQAMVGLKVDTKGLRGGPLEWTAENHVRTRQYYRVYHWDAQQNAIVQAKDWMAFDVK